MSSIPCSALPFGNIKMGSFILGNKDEHQVCLRPNIFIYSCLLWHDLHRAFLSWISSGLSKLWIRYRELAWRCSEQHQAGRTPQGRENSSRQGTFLWPFNLFHFCYDNLKLEITIRGWERWAGVDIIFNLSLTMFSLSLLKFCFPVVGLSLLGSPRKRRTGCFCQMLSQWNLFLFGTVLLLLRPQGLGRDEGMWKTHCCLSPVLFFYPIDSCLETPQTPFSP